MSNRLVGAALIAGLMTMLWLQVSILRGDFGPGMQEGSRMFWGIR